MSSRSTPTSSKSGRSVHKTLLTPKNVRSGTPKVTKSTTKSVLNDSDALDRCLNIGFSLPTPTSRSSSKKPEASQLTKAKSTLSVCPTPPRAKILQKSSSLKSLTTPSYSLATTSSSTSTPVLHKRLLKPATTAPGTPECFTKVSLETPLRRLERPNLSMANASMISSSGKGDGDGGEISNLKVAVRVRPLNTKELLATSVSNVVQVDGHEVLVFAGNTADNTAGLHHRFQYDHAFWSCNTEHQNYCGQEEVFNELAAPLLDRAFEGYNTCLFAYGQTSSGKSYSMMGIDSGTDDEEIRHSEAGIIPRFCQELFQRLDEAKGRIQAEVEVSYFEIYNEKIHDLLSVTTAPLSTSISSGSTALASVATTPNAAAAAKKSLRVREHSIWGPYVVDLSTHPVDSHVALRNWLALGNSQRATAATGMNDKSSRSHSIFNIVLNLTERLGDGAPGKEDQIQTKRSKISLVDLAGSERVSCTGASGDRLKEGVSINKSLLTLGKVIAALSTGKKGFVPYRESVLTWLLRENLGGNSRTVMLATISPASIHLDETLATLRYACQARTIINRVKVNEDPHDKIIRELRAEVDRLQALQQDFDRQQKRQSIEPRKIVIETSVDETEVKALKDELWETRQELAKAERSWLDRLREAEAVRKTEMKMLQKKGLALEFSVEQKQACLVNLAADPMLSGTLLYIIPMGIVRVGRMRPAAFNDQPDIVLEGPLVAFDHCVIENEGGRLYVRPIAEDFETFINGELVEGVKRLFDGDRLVIGGSHYFRVSNPNCERRSQQKPQAGDSQAVVDFQWAHQEILAQQERRLREELEMEKQMALQQIREHQRAAEQEFEERLQNLEIEKHQIKCSKEILENEVAMYKTQHGAEDLLPRGVYKSGYQSTLLEDIQRMMARPTKESLHQIQMKVKEATQRCRGFAAPYEFRQTQKADALGIFHAVVTIIDRQRSKVAEWPPARLDVWLDMVRESDFDKDKLFDCVETVWMDWDEMDRLEESFSAGGGGGDSLNSSRIGLNLSAMRDKLMMVAGRSPQRPSPLIKSALKESVESHQKRLRMKQQQMEAMGVKKSLNFDDEENELQSNRRILGVKNGVSSLEKLPKDRRLECINVELKDLQQGTSRLKKLCTNGDAVKEVQKKALNKACHEIERQLAIIKAVLERGDEVENVEAVDVVKTPKSVRFLLD